MVLRCGGVEQALDEEQFWCFRWAFTRGSRARTEIARMFQVGGEFGSESQEQIAAFVADTRALLGDPLDIDREDERHPLMKTIERLGLVHLRSRRRKSRPHRGREEIDALEPVATLGEVTPMVEMLSIVESIVRRARYEELTLDIQLRDVGEFF